jgi:hypothetical protein
LSSSSGGTPGSIRHQLIQRRNRHGSLPISRYQIQRPLLKRSRLEPQQCRVQSFAVPGGIDQPTDDLARAIARYLPDVSSWSDGFEDCLSGTLIIDEVFGHEGFKTPEPFGSRCSDELCILDVVEAELARSHSRFIVTVHALSHVAVRERPPVLLKAAVELFSDA